MYPLLLNHFYFSNIRSGLRIRKSVLHFSIIKVGVNKMSARDYACRHVAFKV